MTALRFIIASLRNRTAIRGTLNKAYCCPFKKLEYIHFSAFLALKIKPVSLWAFENKTKNYPKRVGHRGLRG